MEYIRETQKYFSYYYFVSQYLLCLSARRLYNTHIIDIVFDKLNITMGFIKKANSQQIMKSYIFHSLCLELQKPAASHSYYYYHFVNVYYYLRKYSHASFAYGSNKHLQTLDKKNQILLKAY